MNAPCTLHTVRIRVLTPKIPLMLCDPDTGEKVPGIRAGERTHSEGYFPAIPTNKGWLLIHHPREGIGLVGLPINGIGGSWHAAWEDALISIDICLEGRWKEVDEWTMLAPVGAL